MSGGTLPYHLRSNKAVDRSVLMELLIKLSSFQSFIDYEYIGFGAVYMEDFKLMHSTLSISKMTCIEQELNICNRQIFNKPLSCLEFAPTTSKDFIENLFNPNGNSIVWLDYADPKELGSQLREYQALLGQMRANDVIKITLNANPKVLDTEGNDEDLEKRLENLKERLSDNMPEKIDDVEVNASMMQRKRYPKVLYEALIKASQIIFPPVGTNILYPLTSFSYADSNHQMMTFTAMIIESHKIQELEEKTKIKEWEYFVGHSNSPQVIEMPDLTLRERLMIDALLPCEDVQQIQQKLTFNFGKNEKDSINKIKSYVRYYKHYPHFSRIGL